MANQLARQMDKYLPHDNPSPAELVNEPCDTVGALRLNGRQGGQYRLSISCALASLDTTRTVAARGSLCKRARSPEGAHAALALGQAEDPAKILSRAPIFACLSRMHTAARFHGVPLLDYKKNLNLGLLLLRGNEPPLG